MNRIKQRAMLLALCITMLAGVVQAGGAEEKLTVAGLLLEKRPETGYAAYADRYSGQDRVQDVLYAGEAVLVSPGMPVDVTVTVDADGFYYPQLSYVMVGDNILSNSFALLVDGEMPFDEASMLTLDTYWTQKDTFDVDRYGNEVITMPQKYRGEISCALRDKMGYYADGFGLYLTGGEHTLRFSCSEGAFELRSITAAGEQPYDAPASGMPQGHGLIQIEAEHVLFRSSPNIRPASAYAASLSPAAGEHRAINHIEEASYDAAGDLLVYAFEVEQAGFYALALHMTQTALPNYQVYRTIRIDGCLPSEDFRNAAFGYYPGFEYAAVQTENGDTAYIYLTEGTHTLSLRSSIDPMRPALELLSMISDEMSALTLEISKMTGGNSDKYRDFNLASYGFEVRADLNRWMDEIGTAYAYLNALAEKSNPGALSNLSLSIDKLRVLEKKPNDLPKKLSLFSQGSSSAGGAIINTVTELASSPMGLDSICFYMQEEDLPKPLSTGDRLNAAVTRFADSFQDQNYEATGSVEGRLQVWVNRPRQMLEIIQRMTDTDFTAKTGIAVDFSIMPDESKLILAKASGSAPDVALSVTTSRVYELAVRGALVDLRQFDTFKTVAKRFPAGLLIPAACNEGLYALPETFSFNVLFYRKDILESLGLEIPDDQEEVLALLPSLHRYGMNYNNFVANSIGYKGFGTTMPYIFQSGGRLYEKGNIKTLLGQQETLDGLRNLTDSFIYYDMDFEVASFYQSMRDGTLPIGTGDLFTFTQLLNAAPELSGKWGIALYPGIRDENGEVQRWISGAAQSDLIFSSSQMLQEAWQFLDWWMSDEVQTEFAYTLQATLGNEYIWTGANMNAFAQAPLPAEYRDVIVEQAAWIYETPRVPGSYMVEREISNAIYSVVNDGENLRQALDEAVKRIDKEVERKLEEFGWLKDGTLTVSFSVPDLDEIKGWLE